MFMHVVDYDNRMKKWEDEKGPPL